MLKIEDLEVSYGAVQALRGISIKYWLLRHICDKANYSGRTAQFK